MQSHKMVCITFYSLAGVDDCVSATLIYSNKRMAVLNCSLATSMDPVAIISGSVPCGKDIHKGMIKVSFITVYV